MNIALLKKVRDYIAKYPEKYDQGGWCGTTCCVAGHAVVLGRRITRREMDVRDSGDFEINGREVSDVAASLLDLNDEQAGRLFDPWWSRVADGRFELIPGTVTPKQRSRIAVKRINHFIKTRGAE